MILQNFLICIAATTLLLNSIASYADENANGSAKARAKPYHIYKDMIIKSSPNELLEYEFLHPKKPCRYVGEGINLQKICD